jgi:hypothetical protein
VERCQQLLSRLQARCCVPLRRRDAKERTVTGGEQAGELLGDALPQLTFEITMKMPMKGNSKLLSKILKKLKIYKNKSCSTFQTLQLSQ